MSVETAAAAVPTRTNRELRSVALALGIGTLMNLVLEVAEAAVLPELRADLAANMVFVIAYSVVGALIALGSRKAQAERSRLRLARRHEQGWPTPRNATAWLRPRGVGVHCAPLLPRDCGGLTIIDAI